MDVMDTAASLYEDGLRTREAYQVKPSRLSFAPCDCIEQMQTANGMFQIKTLLVRVVSQSACVIGAGSMQFVG